MEQAGTIAAVLSGFITAFAAEPIKNLIQDLTERHRLRKALYAEVSNMHEAWNGFLKLLSNPELKLDWAAAAKVNTRADCYVYIKKSDPILFYNLKNAGKLEIAYRNFFYRSRTNNSKWARSVTLCIRSLWIHERPTQKRKDSVHGDFPHKFKTFLFCYWIVFSSRMLSGMTFLAL